MPPRSTSALFISVLMHGAVVAIIVFLAYLADQSSSESPKVFDLVAGAGDNYGATEAPALGSPDGIKIEVPGQAQAVAVAPPPDLIPTPAIPTPEAEPPTPEPMPQEQPSPVTLAPAPAPAPAKAKPKPKTDAVPNFTKNLKRIENKRAARLMAKYKKQLEAEQKREHMSYDEYMKQHGGAQGAARESSEGIAGGVAGGSRSNKTGGAGGKALTREEGDLLDAYYALLRARIAENLVAPPDASDRLEAYVEFYSAADGAISRVHIIQSSGNADFDQAVLEAFAHTRSIGARPDGRGETAKLHVGVRDSEE